MAVSGEKESSCKIVKKSSHKRKRCRHRSQHRTASESGLLYLSAGSAETPIVYGNANSESEEKLVTAMLNSPFNKVCRLLQQLDIDGDNDLISETILHFSLRIYGLPECHREDLPLAIYLFIEDTFGIASKIELCVKLHEDGDSNVIGVVFETIRMKYSVLKNDELLDGAEVRMKDNKDLQWIIDAFSAN